MLILLSVLHYILCIILILVILLQAGRGSGLTSGGIGGEGTQSLFGTKTSAFMIKVTTIAAVGFLLTCLLIDITSSLKSKSLMTKANKNFEITQELKDKIEELKVKQENKKEVATNDTVVGEDNAQNMVNAVAEVIPSEAELMQVKDEVAQPVVENEKEIEELMQPVNVSTDQVKDETPLTN